MHLQGRKHRSLPDLNGFFGGGAFTVNPRASAFRVVSANGDRSSAMRIPMTVSTSMCGPSYVWTGSTDLEAGNLWLHWPPYMIRKWFFCTQAWRWIRNTSKLPRMSLLGLLSSFTSCMLETTP